MTSADRPMGEGTPNVRQTEYFIDARGAIRNISWGAIFAGLFVALVLQLILTLLGLAIGVSIAGAADPNAAGLGWGAGIWWLLSSLIALFAGGWVAARMAGSIWRLNASLHGLVTGALAIIVSVWVLGSAIGNLAGGALNILSGASSTAVTAASTELGAAVAQVDPWTDVERNIRAEVGQDMSMQEFNDLSASIRFNLEANDKQEAVAVLTSRTQIGEERAQQLINDWDTLYAQTQAELSQQWQEARQEVSQMAEGATGAAIAAAWWMFIILTLSLAASAFGGAVGVLRKYGDEYRAPKTA